MLGPTWYSHFGRPNSPAQVENRELRRVEPENSPPRRTWYSHFAVPTRFEVGRGELGRKIVPLQGSSWDEFGRPNSPSHFTFLGFAQAAAVATGACVGVAALWRAAAAAGSSPAMMGKPMGKQPQVKPAGCDAAATSRFFVALLRTRQACGGALRFEIAGLSHQSCALGRPFFDQLGQPPKHLLRRAAPAPSAARAVHLASRYCARGFAFEVAVALQMSGFSPALAVLSGAPPENEATPSYDRSTRRASPPSDALQCTNVAETRLDLSKTRLGNTTSTISLRFGPVRPSHFAKSDDELGRPNWEYHVQPNTTGGNGLWRGIQVS